MDCHPEGGRVSLDRLEFPNAISFESPHTFTEPTAAGEWAQRKITGTFRHDWNVRRFPFDRQLLKILIEEVEMDTRSVKYEADNVNSSFDKDLQPTGWHILSTKFVALDKRYDTTFGNPDMEPGKQSTYARGELRILLERSDYNGFIKHTVAAFAAALMGLASYGLRIDNPSALSPRFGLLAGSTFAAVISLRTSTNELGAGGYITLIDMVHAVVLLYILVATAAGVISWRRLQRRVEPCSIRKFERRAAGISTTALIALVLLLVLYANTF